MIVFLLVSAFSFFLLLEREREIEREEEGREKGREENTRVREKHHLVASHTHPVQGGTPNPGRESN